MTQGNIEKEEHTIQRNQIIAVVVIVVIVGAAGAYLLMTPPRPTGQTLVWETIGNPDYMDPHNNYESFGSWVHYNVYETLYTYEFDSLSTDPTVPLLAEDLTISDDGLNYTFTLRQGITFHDGTPFNASSVQYNFERMLATFDPSGPVWMVAEPILGGAAIENAVYGSGPGSDDHVGNFTEWADANEDGTGAVLVLDTYTVRIRLAYPYVPFLASITYAVGSMISPTCVEANGGIEIGSHNDYLDENTCGTGPYMVTEWTPDVNIVLARNENYWRADSARANFPNAGAIDEVIIKTNEDVNSRILNIQAEEADVVYWPTTHATQVYNNVSAPAFSANDGTQQSLTPNTLKVWAQYPTFNIASIHFTMSETMNETTLGRVVENPYKVINFRKALSHAFDYETLIDTVANGFGNQFAGPIPTGMFGYPEDASTYAYDIEEAVSYWNDAMNNNGLDDILANNSYTLVFYYNSGNTVRENAQLLLADGLRAVIDHDDAEQPGEELAIQVQGLEWSNYLHAAIAGEVGCWMIGWAPDYADPDNYVAPYAKSTGTFGYWARLGDSPGWNTAEVDGWIETAAQSLDEEERETLYAQITEAVYEHAAYIWVYQGTTLFVTGSNVYDGQYACNPMHGAYFYHMYKT